MDKVIPRDLFNTSIFLENLGYLYLKLKELGLEKLLIHDSDDFNLRLLPEHNEYTLDAISLNVKGNEDVCFYRTVNNSDKYSMRIDWFTDSDGEEIEVFASDGELSENFKELLL